MLCTKLTSKVYAEHSLNTHVYTHDVRLVFTKFAKVVLMYLICMSFLFACDKSYVSNSCVKSMEKT